jgi:hypothetical protein
MKIETIDRNHLAGCRVGRSLGRAPDLLIGHTTPDQESKNYRAIAEKFPQSSEPLPDVDPFSLNRATQATSQEWLGDASPARHAPERLIH